MNDSNSDNTLTVTFSPTFAWMLIIFGCIFFVLGIMFMMPFIPRQNVLLGLGIMAASAGGVMGGRVWLRNLPVVMQLTPEGVDIPRKKTTYRWCDIDRVDVKNVYVNGQVSYLCIRLKPESKERYNIGPDGFFAKAIKAVGGDYDLVFNDQEFSMTANQLRAEIQSRM